MNGPSALTKRAIVLAVLAAGMGRLALTDAYLAYVKSTMRIPLLASAVVLILLALASAAAADRSREDDHDEDHDDAAGDEHEHAHFPRIGLGLVVPVICIALVPIFPLGADAVTGRAPNAIRADRSVAARDGADGSRGGSGAGTDALAAGGTVTVLDFVDRAINDPANPFSEPVTLVGFVSKDSAITDGFVLSRFIMSCCAADAQPLLVHVRSDGPAPPIDSWVEVTGVQIPAPDDMADEDRVLTQNIVLEATEVLRIDQPTDPYETY